MYYLYVATDKKHEEEKKFFIGYCTNCHPNNICSIKEKLALSNDGCVDFLQWCFYPEKFLKLMQAEWKGERRAGCLLVEFEDKLSLIDSVTRKLSLFRREKYPTLNRLLKWFSYIDY